MGEQYSEINKTIKQFIEDQKVFFVGTAASEGRVNVSPKGMDSLRVIDSKRIIWLNLTGSGNETAAHVLKNARMTIMFCAFEGKPMILRLYGTAKTYHVRNEAFQDHIKLFKNTPGARQIFEMEVDLVKTSCGFGVPFLDFKEERSMLRTWAEKKSPDDIKKYWKEKNTLSIDDYETGILE